MLEYEVRRGATSTLFTSVDADLSASGAAVIDRRGGKVGLLWRPSDTQARSLRDIGMLGIEPLATPRTLEDQLQALREIVPSGHDVRTVQTIDGLWSRRWAAPFRVMEAHDLTLDTSYRPAHPGFSWGTGLPFRPLTRRGLPLSVREMPIVFPDAPGVPLDVGPILRRSQQGHHQAVTVDVSPARFADDPSVVQFERWLEIFDDAERFDHWVTDPATYHDFARARRQVTVSSTFRSVDRIPETAGEQLEEARRELRRERKLPTTPSSTNSETNKTDDLVKRLRIDANATRVDMALVVPESIDGFDFRHARRRATGGAGATGRRLKATRASFSGARIRKVPLDTGANAIDVYYTAGDGDDE
jgi:hypothetical protein